jgi:hypothetical protein
MARNRVIYQSEAVLVSQNVNCTGVQTGDNDIAELNRIQSSNYSFSISRQDVNQFGELASIDRIITETPTVSFDASWLVANLGNENKLGFHIWADQDTATNTPVSCISGLIDSEVPWKGSKNYFILTTKEGADAINNTVTGDWESVIGIGNVNVTSYSTEASVGGLPTASISAEGQNMNMHNLPYTGMYDGYTGWDTLPVTQPYWYPGSGDGYGFDQGTLPSVITAQGASTPTVYGASATAIYLDGSVDSFPVTSPAGHTFSFGFVTDTDAGATGSFVLSQGAERGASFLYTDGLTFSAGTGWNAGYSASGTLLPSFISGSNPSINPTNGIVTTWEGKSPNGASVMRPSQSNAAPVKMPIPACALTPDGTGNISTLRPGDITLSISRKDGAAMDLPGGKITNAHIQSYTIGFDLSRTPIQKLGSRFAFARPVDFPISATLSLDAILSDLTTGSISNIIDCDVEYNATILLKHAANCADPTDKASVMNYEMKGIKLDSESYSSSIGDNKTVSYEFSCQVGGPDQTDVGVFMSGFYTGVGGDYA